MLRNWLCYTVEENERKGASFADVPRVPERRDAPLLPRAVASPERVGLKNEVKIKVIATIKPGSSHLSGFTVACPLAGATLGQDGPGGLGAASRALTSCPGLP